MVPQPFNNNLDFTDEQIRTVWDLLSRYRDDMGTFGVRERLIQGTEQLGERESYLLSFIRFFRGTDNAKWRRIDESVWWAVPPAPYQKATFGDFINVIRFYQRKKITVDNEKLLVQFLTGCTEYYQEFYLAIITKATWMNQLFSYAVLGAIVDVRKIKPEAIFGKPVPLTMTFGELAFPLCVMPCPPKDMSLCVISKVKTGNVLHVYKLPYKKGDKPFTTVGKKGTHLFAMESFAVVGYYDEERGKVYGFDLHRSLGSYRVWSRSGKSVFDYPERIQRLKLLTERSLQSILVDSPRELAIDTLELVTAVGSALKRSDSGFILLTREYDTPIRYQAVKCKGLIDSIWTEDGVAKGLRVWHNARVLTCQFDFSGKYNALLFNSESIRGRVVDMYLFDDSSITAAAVHSVNLEEKPYTTEDIEFSDGTKGLIEKCIYCARSNIEHKARGVCNNTWMNWCRIFGSNGPDNWFSPTPTVRERRRATGWSPDLVNKVRYSYKGYVIVANEQGQLMFKSDPEEMAAYKEQIAQIQEYLDSIGEHNADRSYVLTPEAHRLKYLHFALKMRNKNVGRNRPEQEEHGSSDTKRRGRPRKLPDYLPSEEP